MSIFQKAIDVYGADNQLTVCIEELSELIKELCKVKRGVSFPNNLAEAMADAKIALEQLDIIVDNKADVEVWYNFKVGRLKMLLEADKS